MYSTTPPVYSTTLPVYSTTLPVYSTTLPECSTTLPVYSTTLPVYSTTLPVYSTTLPVYSTTLPVYSTTLPVYSTTLPVYSTTLPVYSTTLPVALPTCLHSEHSISVCRSSAQFIPMSAMSALFGGTATLRHVELYQCTSSSKLLPNFCRTLLTILNIYNLKIIEWLRLLIKIILTGKTCSNNTDTNVNVEHRYKSMLMLKYVQITHVQILMLKQNVQTAPIQILNLWLFF